MSSNISKVTVSATADYPRYLITQSTQGDVVVATEATDFAGRVYWREVSTMEELKATAVKIVLSVGKGAKVVRQG